MSFHMLYVLGESLFSKLVSQAGMVKYYMSKQGKPHDVLQIFLVLAKPLVVYY
jgi:hypothetical protein